MTKDQHIKRKNIYIPSFVDDWVKSEAVKRGLRQSTFISLVLQEKMNHEKAMDSISDMDRLIEEIKKLKED